MAENGTKLRDNSNGQDFKPEWTIMVYLAGDNNLTANCIGVLQQLEAVEYSEDVSVLACFDSNTPWPKGSRYLTVSSRRRQVNNGLNWEIHNDLVPPVERDHAFTPPSFCCPTPPPNGDPVTRTDVAVGLDRFLEWSMIKNEPSERYMLILYGHGPVVAGQSFLARDNPPSSLRLEDLKAVLGKYFNADRKLDVLACQNCVMNGIETAFEIKDQVKFMIGSQGLVLATGWPYEKIVGAIVEEPRAATEEINLKLLQACARNLLDFTVMDRSSEQSVCNLQRLNDDGNIITAIGKLVEALKDGLTFDFEQKEPALKFPVICDAVKLARLEAQSYWAERFVDLYDFCERLLKKCNEALVANNALLRTMGCAKNVPKVKFKDTPVAQALTKIMDCCIPVMNEIEGNKRRDKRPAGIVEQSYYIGADLQYSHGLSVYFPWTLPCEPYFFTKGASGTDYVLRTAFETYSDYGFVKVSGWAGFLDAFFRATLRKVRRSDRDFYLLSDWSTFGGLVGQHIHAPADVLAIDLQKSSSDTGRIDYEVWSTVKNYPRRNYLAPADCPRRLESAGRQLPGEGYFLDPQSPPVSYLGWNMPALVADIVRYVNGSAVAEPSIRSKAAAGTSGASGPPPSVDV
jgi:hypothetical protein